MTIYIPNKIKVGYQNRKDTYTSKLAYVIYYDEKGKLRKETSWQNWRDESIEPDDFENVPTEGFVLNKKVGGVENSWGWNARQSYCRVYDPRGFEFEIDIYNLLYILEYCDSIKGKGLVGKFVYGWDGKDLVLIPEDSPDYKEHMKLSSIINNNKTIKAKDLKIGATYIDKNNNEYVYMGKFDYYDPYCYEINGKVFFTYKSMVKYCEENNVPYYKGISCWDRKRLFKEGITASVGKRHWFATNTEHGEFIRLKSISNKFIQCINEKCAGNYSELYEKMECDSSYSPIDEDKIEYCYYTYEEFLDKCEKNYWINFISDINGSIKTYEVHRSYDKDQTLEFYNHDVLDVYDCFDEKLYRDNELEVSFKDCFEKLKPMYRQVYLKNGKKYKRSDSVK